MEHAIKSISDGRREPRGRRAAADRLHALTIRPFQNITVLDLAKATPEDINHAFLAAIKRASSSIGSAGRSGRAAPRTRRVRRRRCAYLRFAILWGSAETMGLGLVKRNSLVVEEGEEEEAGEANALAVRSPPPRRRRRRPAASPPAAAPSPAPLVATASKLSLDEMYDGAAARLASSDDWASATDAACGSSPPTPAAMAAEEKSLDMRLSIDVGLPLANGTPLSPPPVTPPRGASTGGGVAVAAVARPAAIARQQCQRR